MRSTRARGIFATRTSRFTFSTSPRRRAARARWSPRTPPPASRSCSSPRAPRASPWTRTPPPRPPGRPRAARAGVVRARRDGGGNGATPVRTTAMHARRKRFVHYLANEQRRDVWDGRSPQRVIADGLLRQGRESAEVIVEASVVDHREATARERDAGARRRAALGAAKGTDEPAGVARGKLLVRLINVGRRPDKRLLPPEEAPAEPLGAGVERSLRATGANSVRVRAVPETGGRLAAALKGGAVSSPLPGENVPPSSVRTVEVYWRAAAPAAAAGDRRGPRASRRRVPRAGAPRDAAARTPPGSSATPKRRRSRFPRPRRTSARFGTSSWAISTARGGG